AWCMRRTLHLLPSEDLAIFVRGSARRAEQEIRWVLRKGVPSRILERLIDTALTALDEPLTRRELAERIRRSLRAPMRGYVGGGWGSRATIPAVAVGGMTFPIVYLLHLIGARGVICSGPSRGNEPTFVRADAWIPRWRDVPRERAEAELLYRYLRAFGPATPTDFRAWNRMPLADAREIWAREEAEIARVRVDGQEAWILREDLAALTSARITRPHVRLLPYFDTFLLGHDNRAHLVAAGDQKKVYRAQGWIAPVVLVDGRVVGVWAHARERDRLQVRITKFAPLTQPIKSAIRAEALDLGRFVGANDVDVRT
ncbi:MAG: winged helix DNA-binding domain-containing protein, partial [bacterium]